MASAWSLWDDPDEMGRLARALGASVNVAILRELAKARRRGEGWLYLSEIAEKIAESPGTVSIAIQKLSPLVEERREKGLRYFRANLTDLRIEIDTVDATGRRRA